jgi:hypothetical protein
MFRSSGWVMFRRRPRLRGQLGFLRLWPVRAWAAKSRGDEHASEFDSHAVVGRFGLCGVPAGSRPVFGGVVGCVAVQGVGDSGHSATDQARTSRYLLAPMTTDHHLGSALTSLATDRGRSASRTERPPDAVISPVSNRTAEVRRSTVSPSAGPSLRLTQYRAERGQHRCGTCGSSQWSSYGSG